jgi:transposase
MLITYKAKIIAEKETSEILNNLCFSATKLYNTVNYYLRKEWFSQRALADYLDAIGYPHEGVKIPLNRTFLQSQFKENHWATNLHSQSAQFVIGEVLSAYKSWFALRKNGHNASPPGFRRKSKLSPVTFIQSSHHRFSRKGKTYLRLSLGSKREDGIKEITFKITHRKNLPQNGTLKNVKITYDTVTGNYYAHLVISVPSPVIQLQLFPTNVVAIDLGLNNLITATFSDGTTCIKTRGLYVCDCGNKINADRNGANNILKRYLRYRSSGSVALPVVTLVLQRTDGSLRSKLLSEANILSTNL